MFIMLFKRKIVHDSSYMSQICRPNRNEFALYKCCEAKGNKILVDQGSIKAAHARWISPEKAPASSHLEGEEGPQEG